MTLSGLLMEKKQELAELKESMSTDMSEFNRLNEEIAVLKTATDAFDKIIQIAGRHTVAEKDFAEIHHQACRPYWRAEGGGKHGH